MATRSPWIHHILLTIGALVLLAALYYSSTQFFQPLTVPPAPPARTQVRFAPKLDVTANPLFQELKGVVTGEVEPGVLGSLAPFVGPDRPDGLSDGQISRLASGEELMLHGAIARDLAHASDGTILVLVHTIDEGTGGLLYIIRKYLDRSGIEVTRWMASEQVGLQPVRIAQDSSGTIWVASFNGRIGTVVPGSAPVWRSETELSLFAPTTDLEIDALDRVWITDGLTVFVGGEQSFTPLDLSIQLSEEDRVKFGNELSALPENIRPTPLEGPDGLIRAALLPEGLYPYGGGRMGLTTGYSAFTFPLAFQNASEWSDTLEASALSLIVDHAGGVWALRYTDGALLRMTPTSTREFTGATAPRDARTNPDLFASDGSKLYSVDYASSSKILWSTIDDSWAAEVIVASGTLPNDRIKELQADSSGNLWMIMSQGGLVRIERRAEGSR